MKEEGDGLLPLGKPIWPIEHLNFIFISRFWTINYCLNSDVPWLLGRSDLKFKIKVSERTKHGYLWIIKTKMKQSNGWGNKCVAYKTNATSTLELRTRSVLVSRTSARLFIMALCAKFVPISQSWQILGMLGWRSVGEIMWIPANKQIAETVFGFKSTIYKYQKFIICHND